MMTHIYWQGETTLSSILWELFPFFYLDFFPKMPFLLHYQSFQLENSTYTYNMMTQTYWQGDTTLSIILRELFPFLDLEFFQNMPFLLQHIQIFKLLWLSLTFTIKHKKVERPAPVAVLLF